MTVSLEKRRPVVHLTLTGPNAGQAGCLAVRFGVPEWGHDPLPEGDRGLHYAYAPAEYVNGTHPDVCQDCVAAFRDA